MLSISKTHIKDNPKAYTFGFKPVKIESLKQLAVTCNNYSVSIPEYQDGCRNNKNIISMGNYIFIDCDKEGQTESIEDKLQHYNYVKVPSQSNLHYPYKFHFIVPTQKELSANANIYRYQVETFFHQVGITNNDIDTSGSFDIVRQFAPAVVDKYKSEKDNLYYGLTQEEAEELTYINDTGINVPITDDIPEDYKNNSITSITPSIKIDSVKDIEFNTFENIRDNVLDRKKAIYYLGKAVLVDDVEKMIFKTITESTHQYISGFGCPCCNSEHSDSISKPYGFAFINSLGSITIKCTGNACKDNPYYIIPIATDNEITFTKPEIKESHILEAEKFKAKWEGKLGNKSNPMLVENWIQNYSAFDDVIKRNKCSLEAIKYISPSQTGSGKTQQVIDKAISLASTDTKTLIVVLRTEDADLIANQIQDETSSDYVAVYHKRERTQTVNLAEETKLNDYQCLVITHSMFLKHPEIVDDREFIVIDEAINAVNHISISQSNLLLLDYIYKKNKLNNDTVDIIQGLLHSLEHITKTHKNNTVKELWGNTGSVTKIKQVDSICYDVLKDVDFIKIRNKVRGTENQNIAIRNDLIELLDTLPEIFNNWCYVSQSANEICFNTALEIIPTKSVIIMDATATVNSLYHLYSKYKKNLLVLPKLDCRNYMNVTLYTTKGINTGRNTLLSDIKSKIPKYPNYLMDNIMKDLKPDDKVLVVTFKELLPILNTQITVDNIQINNWGNLTGSNAYNDFNKIYLFGLNHKPLEVIRNQHTLAKGFNISFLDNEENKQEIQSLKASDLASEIIQAINRIRCRRTIDNDGNCLPCEVYLTLPDTSEAYLIKQYIEKEMINIKSDDWLFLVDNEITKAKANLCESYLMQLDYISKDGQEVKHEDILTYLGITKEQFRKHIKTNKIYKDTISDSYIISERPILDKKNRLRKSKDLYYFKKYIANKVP